MNIKKRIATGLIQVGFSADFLTWLGLGLAFAAAYFVWVGEIWFAGIALLLSGLMDLLDGAVARESGKASVFGGILDSSLDRYGDGAVLGAILYRFAAIGVELMAFFALLALVGSFAISYVRARAECEFESCRVGFWERGERLVFLAIGLLTGRLEMTIAILAAGVQWTVCQRILLSKQMSSKTTPNWAKLSVASRNQFSYYLKVILLIFAQCFLPWPR